MHASHVAELLTLGTQTKIENSSTSRVAETVETKASHCRIYRPGKYWHEPANYKSIKTINGVEVNYSYRAQ